MRELSDEAMGVMVECAGLESMMREGVRRLLDRDWTWAGRCGRGHRGGVRIGVLGSVEVYDLDGAVLPLRRAKTRALLVVLVIHLNRRVSRDALLEALWGETPPAGAEDTLQSYVSQLRRALSLPEAKEPAAQLRTRSGAYVLEVDPELVDACCFERLAAEGAGALRAGDATGAEAVLSRVLSLWRGQAYAEFADQPFAQAASERLEEIRLTALEDHFDAALALGCHVQVVAELETLTAGHIRRERLSAQLMLALYRSGRQADAHHRWRQLLDRHNDTARRAISRYRGRLVKMTGDGLLATFDGPGRAVRCACTIQDEVKTSDSTSGLASTPARWSVAVTT